MPNFSSLARLEVPEKFVWWWVGGGVCKVIFMVNPTVVLRLGLGWGFDNTYKYIKRSEVLISLILSLLVVKRNIFTYFTENKYTLTENGKEKDNLNNELVE